MFARATIPSVYPDTDHGDDAYVLVCINTMAIPYVCAAISPLLRRSRWQTEVDWQRAVQGLLEFKVALMSGCPIEILTEQAALLGFAHSMTPSADLAATMPNLNAAMQKAIDNQQNNVLDTIYRHGKEAPTQESQNKLICALVGATLAALTDLPPAAIAAACAALMSDDNAISKIMEIAGASIHRETNQTEEYLHNLQAMLGPVTNIEVPDP